MQDIFQYLDQYGFIQLDKSKDGSGQDNISQNGQLWTGQTYLLAAKKGKVAELGLASRWREAMLTTEVTPGVYNRTASKPAEHNSLDNLIGILAGGVAVGDRSFAQKIEAYGETHYVKLKDIVDLTETGDLKPWQAFILKRILGGIKCYYNFNCETPGVPTFFGWWGRSPGAVCLIKMAAGKNPTLLQKIGLMLGQIISARATRENRDPWSLGWAAYQISYRHSWIVDIGNNYFMKKLKQNFPKNSLGPWLKSEGPIHDYWED